MERKFNIVIQVRQDTHGDYHSELKEIVVPSDSRNICVKNYEVNAVLEIAEELRGALDAMRMGEPSDQDVPMFP